MSWIPQRESRLLPDASGGTHPSYRIRARASPLKVTQWDSKEPTPILRDRAGALLFPLPDVQPRHVRIRSRFELRRSVRFAVAEFQRVAVQLVDALAGHGLAVAGEGQVERLGPL